MTYGKYNGQLLAAVSYAQVILKNILTVRSLLHPNIIVLTAAY